MNFATKTRRILYLTQFATYTLCIGRKLSFNIIFLAFSQMGIYIDLTIAGM